MEIIVEHRFNYGTNHYYPLSDDAKTLCLICGRDTLTPEQLAICHEYGWKVEARARSIVMDEIMKQAKKTNQKQG
jgi:hypothetical protein